MCLCVCTCVRVSEFVYNCVGVCSTHAHTHAYRHVSILHFPFLRLPSLGFVVAKLGTEELLEFVLKVAANSGAGELRTVRPNQEDDDDSVPAPSNMRIDKRYTVFRKIRGS